MGDKKASSKHKDEAGLTLTGRIAGLKVAQESCEFHVKDGKNGTRHFAVGNNGGIQFNAVIELLSAAWAGNRKITVQPLNADGGDKAVASISVGKLPKSAKPEKPAKAKSAEPVAAQARDQSKIVPVGAV
jgi:hypothetical protein